MKMQSNDIAIRRRDEFQRPPLAVTDLTRICITCNQSIHTEIREIDRNPTYLRLNVLTQTRNNSYVICNAVANVHRLSIECRVNVFVLQDIYIPEHVRSCRHHLDDNGLFLKVLLPGLQSINRPYAINGQNLQAFLQ